MSAIGIVDYGMGNIMSIRNAVSELGATCDLVSDPTALAGYEKIILPGVGAFGEATRKLNEAGLAAALKERLNRGALLVGICLGMQLMCRSSQESPGAEGLGFFDLDVLRLDSSAHVKIPHIGWTEIEIVAPHWVLAGVENLSDVYFLHSFAAESVAPDTVAKATHGRKFAAVIAKRNAVGIQFHPEKSQKVGLKMLQNVLERASW